MKLRKIFGTLATVGIIVSLIVPSIVLAVNTNILIFGVVENAGYTYPMLPVTATINNSQLVANGQISPSGLNAIVTSNGTELPRMLTTSQTLFASPISANATNPFLYASKSVADSSTAIVIGNGGYITYNDSSYLEPGNYFSISATGYLDTNSPNTSNNTLTNLSGTATGSPVTLVVGTNTITVTVLGTFNVLLQNGMAAAVTSGGSCLVTGSPLQIGQGSNQITTTGSVGTFTVTLTNMKNIVYKDGAVQLCVDPYVAQQVDLAVSASSTTTVTNNGYASYYGVPMSNGQSWIRAGQRFTGFSGTAISSIQLYLYKTGSPTGFAYLRVRDSVTDAVIGTLGSVDVSTLTGAYAYYTFNSTPVYVPMITSDIRIVLEYSGGDGSNYITVGGGSHVYSGGYQTNYRRIGAIWDNNASIDLDWQNLVYYPTTNVHISGVMSGIYTITAALSGNLSLAITGYTTASTAFAGNVIDNANNWLLDQDNVMPYMTSYTHYVNGIQKLLYQPNAIIIGTTLLDLIATAGQNHDGTITFGSNPSGITVNNNSNPSVQTISATNITPNSVILNGSLNGMGSSSLVWTCFAYGVDTTYGSKTIQRQTATAPFAMQEQITTGLLPNTTYHFAAAAAPDGNNWTYGADQTFTTTLSTSATTTVKINSVGLFSNYQTSGDLMIGVEVYCAYTNIFPNQSSSQNFNVVLVGLDDATPIASSALVSWKDRPESIYLNPTLAATLTQGGAYHLWVIGTFAGAVNPYYDYTITNSDWNKTIQDWAKSVCANMESYDNADGQYMTTDTTYGDQITATAGGFFTKGVPQMMQLYPTLFVTSSSKAQVTLPGANDQYSGNHVWTTQVGTQVASDWNTIGNVIFGDTAHGQVTMGYGLLVAVLILCVVGVGLGGKGLAMIVLSFPISLWGAEMGAIGVQWLLVPCIAMVMLWARQFWVKPT